MGGNLVVNILDKIQTYAEANVQVNAQILTATKKTNEILSKEIHNELKKQTDILSKLTGGIEKFAKEGGNRTTNFSLFGGGSKMAKTLVKFFSDIKPKKITAMAKAVDLLSTSIAKMLDAIDKVDEKKLTLVQNFFTSITKGIALFALTVVLAAPALIFGTLVTLPLILLWGAAFNLLGKYNKNIDQGAKGLKTMGIAVGLLGLAVAGYIFFNGGIGGAIINSVVVAFSVFIMTLPMIFIAENSKNLTKAAIGMGIMSLSIWLLGMAVDSYYKALGGDAKDPMSMLLATATVAGSLLIMGGAFWLIGKMATDILKGTVAMILSGVSVIILAKGVEMWMAAKPSWEILAMLGVTVVGLGVAMAAAGAAFSLIIQGAIGMLISSASVLVLAKAVDVWMKAKPKSEELLLLGATIVGLGVAMAGWGLGAMFIIPGAAALLIFSTGLYAFTASLKNFQEAKWNEDMTDVLVSTMESILNGFVGIFDNLSEDTIKKAFFGTFLLGSLGNSLSNLAEGLQSFASGYVPVYEVQDGKLVLVDTKPFDKDLGKRVGETIKALVSPLIDKDSVLYNLGKDQGWFFDGPVGNGIDLLGRLGNSLGNFAKGVQAMAELQVPTYAVNEKGELVLVGTEPLSPTFAEDMGNNIKSMLKPLVGEKGDGSDSILGKFGAQEGAIFSGPVGRGIDLLSNLGNSLSNFAMGVQAMAELKVPTYEVKDGKLVLKSVEPLKPGFAEKVGENIEKIVDALIAPLSKLGKESGTFFNSDFEEGLEMLGKLGDPLAKLGEGVKAFSELDAKGFDGNKIGAQVTAMVKGLHGSFSKESGYDPKQGASLRYFAETMQILSKNMNIKADTSEAAANSIASINKSVNGMDMNKLKTLNKVMINFTKMAKSLKSSFEDIDSILEKLINLMEQLTELKKTGEDVVKTPDSGSKLLNSALPDSIKISNIDEIVSEINELKNVLLGTIDVRIEDDLINR